MHITFADMDQFADTKTDGLGLVYLEGCTSWSRADFEGGKCPICQGRPLKRNHYCTGCDRAGLDGLVEYPGCIDFTAKAA